MILGTMVISLCLRYYIAIIMYYQIVKYYDPDYYDWRCCYDAKYYQIVKYYDHDYYEYSYYDKVQIAMMLHYEYSFTTMILTNVRTTTSIRRAL